MKNITFLIVLVASLTWFERCSWAAAQTNSLPEGARLDQELEWARSRYHGAKYDAYVSNELIPGLKRTADSFLKDRDPQFDSNSYTNVCEYGWNVVYFGKRDLLPTPEIVVFVPKHQATYIDIIPFGRAGWTHRFAQPVRVNTDVEASKCVDGYLRALGMVPEQFTTRISEAFKIEYVPLFGRDKEDKQRGIPESRTAYVSPEPPVIVFRLEFGNSISPNERATPY